MKKKILALILSVQMLLSVITPSMFVMAETFNSNTEEQQSDATGGKSVTTTSIFPECELKWTSYMDYLLNQAKTAWNAPGYYVGYEVEFMPYYQSIECVSGFTGNDSKAYVSVVSSDANSISAGSTVDPSTFKMVIDGYHFEENNGALWYKIKAAEGYELPEVLQQNPYVFHLNGYTLEDIKSTPPAFVIGPVRAIFNTTTGFVNVKKQPDAAASWDTVDVSQLSPIFSVTPVYSPYEYDTNKKFVWDHYDIGDLAAEYTENQYVAAESVILIPAEASAAYEKLLAAEDTYEYYKIIAETPTSVLAQFSEHHRKELDKCIEALNALEQVRYETTVDFGGVSLPISVVGKLPDPDNATLQASVVSNETVVSEGFDVKEDLSDLIVALDIKLINSDGTEWQPKEGRRVAVSIGLSALGYVDGSVVRLQHQHDGFIEDFEIAVVQDGALTVYTSGFSIYAVSRVGDNTQNSANRINDKGTVTLEIAKNTNNEYIFYFNRDKLPNNPKGTWSVKDATGALHYTVHTASNAAVGNNGVYVPWITIHPLKEALSTANNDPNTIKLSFSYNDNGGNNVTTETYTVEVIAPKASAAEHGGRKLYIKDLVNTSGKIVAALTNTDGTEISLAGAAFEWTRSDGYLINLSAYDPEDNYSSVNIAIDHSGLVEARKDEETKKFIPTKYTLKAILSDGDELTAEYTVYYQSEIINADFEFPTTSGNDYYAFFPNGWPELHWKTTAPGSGSNLTKDVEYGLPEHGNADVGVPHAAHGYTMAEINAEAFGALYQDVISVPGEEIVWNFAHAARVTSWARDISNAMFIVLGPTEAAQTLTADQLIALGNLAKNTAGANNTSFLNGKTSVEVTYGVAKYHVWYHKAEAPNNYNAANKYGWTDLEGTYEVPDGQYRTRLFFMSEKGNSNPNAGNLIDQAKGGMYKKYLIQYYSETIENGQEVQTPRETVTGEALLHSSVKLEELISYISSKDDPYYLHKILINGGNYPYNVKYEGDASLYVEKYEDATGFDRSKFGDYDIVMEIYLRDVAITVQTQLVFPKDMTDAQKLSVVQAGSGYQTTVAVNGGGSSDSGTASIKNRDPKGGYTGYYYFNDEIYLYKGVSYSISQTSCTEMPGLKLASTVYYIYYYKQGKLFNTVKVNSIEDGVVQVAKVQLDGEIGFAEIVVENTYEETMTTIYYKAVGHGKVAFNDQEGDLDFSDIPTEKLGYYTAKARGAKVLCGDGATFKGWYKDEACTQLVTDADGVYNEKDGSFTPNANIISTDAITFYAKFETGTLVIERNNAAPGQSFVYCIESADNNLKMYVTLKCDANGYGKVEISEVPAAGKYTVTELQDWSWRHVGETYTKEHEKDKKELKFEFSNSANNKWINGYA